MPDTASDPRVLSLLRQLATFSPLNLLECVDPPGSSMSVDELGIAWDEGGGHILGRALRAAEVWLRGSRGEVRARVAVDRGLVRLPLLEVDGLLLADSQEGGSTLRLPSRSTPHPPPSPVQGLEVVEQALALGNNHDAVLRLRELARDVPSAVRARLAQAAAEAIDAAQREIRPMSSVGQCSAVLAWRSWSGLVTVNAPIAREVAPASELDSELAAALERGGRLGRALARHARGLPESSPVGAPSIDRTPALLKLRDPGGTLALAAALAACSSELTLPVPADIVALGGLDADGRIAPLSRDQHALAFAAILRERADARVVLSAQTAADTHGVETLRAETLDEAVRLTLGEMSPASLTSVADVRLLDTAELDERAYRRDEALSKARAFLAAGTGSSAERLRAQWLEGACLVHLGRPEEARTSFDLAWRLLRDIEREGPFDRAVAVCLALAEADGFTDLFRYADALSAVEHGRELTGSSIVLRSKLDYFQGYVLVHAGRAAEALVLLERACAHAIVPDAPRFRCWLGFALTDTGDHAEAHAELERGLALAAEAGGEALSVNRAFLLLAQARLELRRFDAGRALTLAAEGLGIARADARISPYPLSSLVHARGAALLLRGEHEAGVAALEDVRGLRAATPFMGLALGLAEIERARSLVDRETDGPRTRDALRRCRELVGGYAPARARFSRELAALAEPGALALGALTSLLRALKY